MSTPGQTVASNLHACQIISGRDTERVAKQIDEAVDAAMRDSRFGLGISMAPYAIWKRRKRELAQLAQPDCPRCFGRGLIKSAVNGIRGRECLCTVK